MTSTQINPEDPILTFEGKKYDLKNLPADVQELVGKMQIADAQLRMHEDTLRVLSIGRQTIGSQLQFKLKDFDPIE